MGLRSGAPASFLGGGTAGKAASSASAAELSLCSPVSRWKESGSRLFQLSSSLWLAENSCKMSALWAAPRLSPARCWRLLTLPAGSRLAEAGAFPSPFFPAALSLPAKPRAQRLLPP